MAAAPLRSPNPTKKLGTESFPQEPNGDLSFLHSSAGGLVDSQPTKLQPYPTLKSPAHPTALYPYEEGKLREEEEEEEDDDDDDEEEEEIEDEDVEMDPAQRKKIWAAINAAHEADKPVMMKICADDCEYARKLNSPQPPPLEMLDYPDLFERAWGWDMLLPICITDPWSKYKEYLSTYYNHNIKEANADGDADGDRNDLISQARLCIEMEGHLLFLWNKYATLFPNDDYKIRQVSEKVTKHARKIVDALEAEFPPATAASLKCITKEAELMCGWLMFEDPSPIYYVCQSNEIREYALSFMLYKKPEPKYEFAMAAMMGVMKEAKVVYQYLWNRDVKNGSMEMSMTIRGRTLGVMCGISDECSSAKESTGGSTAGEHMSNESDGNNFSDNLEDASNNDNFMMGIQGSLFEMNETTRTKMGSEMEGVKNNNTMGRSNDEEPILVQKKELVQKDDEQEGDKINQNTKDQVLLGHDNDESDAVFVGENISYVEADKESNKNDDGSTK